MKKKLNGLKVGLAGVGLVGAVFYVTFDPITILSYGLYILMAALMAPLKYITYMKGLL
jgi:hypothetical protein